MLVTKYLLSALAAAVLTAGGATLADPAFAGSRPSAQCKKAKKAKKAKVAKAKKTKKAKATKAAAEPAPVAAPSKPRMNHETVIGMHRRGATQTEITTTAEKFGYTADAADQQKLAQARVPKTLIAKLAADEPPPPKAEGIKLETITSYDDIDFDAVPPPPGTPGWVKQQNAKKAAKPTMVASAPAPRAQPAVHKASTVRKVQDEEEDERPAPAPTSGRRAIVSAQ